MISKNCGGNTIRVVNKLNKDFNFKGKNYKYFFLILKKDEIKNIKLNYFTIYILKKGKNAELIINKKKFNLKKDDCINFYNCNLNSISSKKGKIEILVSGVTKKTKKKSSINIIKSKKIYTVNKPWGNEKWLNGRGKYYAFKKIFLKSSFKTSLQYHRFKTETNLLYKGKAQLVYKKNNKIKNNLVKNKDIKKRNLKPISEIYVKPKILHRIIALSNIDLFETSTPHLDDVIRVADDVNRPSGLIKSEHKH